MTKSGTNEFHGEFGLQWEVPKFTVAHATAARFTSNDNLVQSTTYFQPNKPSGVNTFPSANISGPIIKDRIWFFGSYTPQIFETVVDTPYYTNTLNTQTLTTVERYRRTRKYEYAFGRLDANPLTIAIVRFVPVNGHRSGSCRPPFHQHVLPDVSATSTPTTKATSCIKRKPFIYRQVETDSNWPPSAPSTLENNWVSDGRYSRGFEKRTQLLYPLYAAHRPVRLTVQFVRSLRHDWREPGPVTDSSIARQTIFLFIILTRGQHELRMVTSVQHLERRAAG